MSDIESAVAAIEKANADLRKTLDSVWAQVQAAYEKMQTTKAREDIDAYREIQAVWLSIPREVRDPRPNPGPGDALVTAAVGYEAGEN